MIIISVVVIIIIITTPHCRSSTSWARNKALPYRFNGQFDSTYRHLNLHMLLTLLRCTLVNKIRGKGKGKGHPCKALSLCTDRTAHRGSRGIALLFLDNGTRRGEGSASRLCRSLPRKRPCTHCTGS